jgi:hypothetical protein
VTRRTFSSGHDSGSTAPLGIGLALISLAAILVFASASSVFLLQRRLTTLAEFAALSKAGYDKPVSEFLLEVGANGINGVRVAAEGAADGFTFELTLCSRWQPPLPGLVVLRPIEVCGSGSARSG